MSRKLCCFLARCAYVNFSKSVLQDGIFNQLRVDCKKEFYPSLVIQELSRELRNDQTISPYRQTPSRKVSIFFAIQSKVRFSQHFEKIYRTDLETLTWFSNLFLRCKLRSKNMSEENRSEKLIWNGRLSINGFP